MGELGDDVRVLGPWVLLAPLAHGGMGSVFIAAKADPREPRTLCLVKTLKTGLASVSDYRPRFLDEARIAVLLRHEHLCQVFGGGEDDGEFWLAMELIEGVTFKRLVSLLKDRGHQLSEAQAVALVVATLRGLYAAHTATTHDGRSLGVVHRDVSPHNVMVDVRGQVKVIDFGLATSVLKETFTESAVVLGKSGYMAPEQARGEDVSPAVDQYAAAIVLYELLTDDRFYGEMQSRQIWAVVGSGNHVPRAWGEILPALQPVLAKALAPRSSDRFSSCADFAAALLTACPAAADPHTIESLGTIVRRLKPSELDLVASARLALAAWDADPEAIGHTSGLTERPFEVDVTASVSRRTGSATRSGARRHHAAELADASDPALAETSATAAVRPVSATSPPPKRRAAAAILGVVVTVGGLGLIVGKSRHVPSPVVTTAPTTTLTPAPPTAITSTPPTTTGPSPAAPIITASSPTPPVPKETPPTATPRVDRQKARVDALLGRREQLRSCAHPCVAALSLAKPDSVRAKPDAFEVLLKNCEEACP
jgi:eukaryotic-like serine/threonine-protein kinase